MHDCVESTSWLGKDVCYPENGLSITGYAYMRYVNLLTIFHDYSVAFDTVDHEIMYRSSLGVLVYGVSSPALQCEC